MERDDGVRYLSTAEVAQRLEVKPATVYAYVSRGTLQSRRLPRQPGSWFAEDAVEALVRGGAARGRTDPMHRVSTRITQLADDDLRYRGFRAGELAVGRSAEAVARLLWTGDLGGDAPFDVDPSVLRAARAAVRALPPGAELTDRLRVAVSAVSATDPLRFDLSPAAVTRAGATSMVAMAAALEVIRS